MTYIENRVPAKPSFHLAWGHAMHLAAETHNQGGSFENGLKLAADDLAKFPEDKLDPYNQQRFRELAVELPSAVAAYFDGVDNTGYEVVAVEQEWSHQFMPGVFLCGRKDKVLAMPTSKPLVPVEPLFAKGIEYSKAYVLCDLKTASEIGKTWSSDFRATMLRDFGLALYDWHEQRIGRTPSTVRVECLVKPYKGKESRLEIFDLPEIAVYRKRFEQQLAWIVAEMKHYHSTYTTVQPWPMAQQNCSTKYGPCDYLQGCNGGWTAKTLANYTNRQEHLNIRMENENAQQSVSKGGEILGPS